MTELALVMAEELDVAFDSIDVLLGDTDLCPYDMGTFGSMTTPLLIPAVRRAGAEARAVLLQLAAEKLDVPIDKLQVKAGVVSGPGQPRASVTYAQLVDGKRIERHLANVPVKDPAAFRTIGKPARRKDGMDKVTGQAKYAGDQIFPGLLHAAILRPPAHGAKLKSADTSAAEKVPGVQVVKDSGTIAVLHGRPDIAAQALALVKAEFENPPSPSSTTSARSLRSPAWWARRATWPKASGSRPAAPSRIPTSTATWPTLPSKPIPPRRVSRTARSPCGPVRRPRSRSRMP
jgi:isoquinoline 1-oxidoreductase